MLVRNTRMALLPKYDSKKSFYGKAEIEEIETRRESKIFLLYSYKTLVCAIIQEKDNAKWLYLNGNIDKELLTSQTTLRHIKEFAKQFYKEQGYTKAELFEYDYITKAIQNKSPEETRQALALYIRLNGYNLEIIDNELEQIKIVFDEPSKAEQIKDILQYLATHNKNYTQKQYYCILQLKELLEG